MFRRFAAILSTAAITGALCAPASAADVTLIMDPVHTTAEFAVQHLLISTVRGTMKITKGDLVIDNTSTVPKAVSVTLDPAAVDTREPKRDENLRSPEFLDVAKYPSMSFKSTRITPSEGKKFKIDGDLTLHGVTKPVTLDAEYVGQFKDPRGNLHMGYTAVTKIDRRDFGMNSDRAVGGGLIAGWEFDIILNVEANRSAI